MMSDGGSWYDAVIVKVPFAGARAVAVVSPLARTRPAVSVACQISAAANTRASPLIVSGLRTRVFASGSFTRIPPRAERSGVGTGVGVGVGLGVGLGLAVNVGVADRTGVGVGVVTTIRLSTHPAPRRAAARVTSAAVLTFVGPVPPRRGPGPHARGRSCLRPAPTPPLPRRRERRGARGRTRPPPAPPPIARRRTRRRPARRRRRRSS